ncbi:MAG: hypothetical protein ACTSYR_03115 [Candidatus Odinarchaeia archaeon]
MSAGIGFKFAYKYPWSLEASEFVANSDINIKELTADLPEVQYAVNRLKTAIDFNSQTQFFGKDILESSFTPYTIPIVNLLISLIGDKRLLFKWGVFESKVAIVNLENERDEIILRLTQGAFNWEGELLDKRGRELSFQHAGMRYDFKLKFNNYISVNTSFHDPHWKLCNKILHEGFVFLTRENFIRIIGEMVKLKITSKSLIKIDKKEVNDSIFTIAEKVKKLWSVKKKNLGIERAFEYGSVNKNCFPPCVTELLSKILNGENISHQGRFTLTSFLLNIGMTEEEVLDVFKNSPDYNEKLTIYQIKHIKGKKGDGTRYSPPSCKTLATYDLCVNKDKICELIRHPLQYYKIKKKRRDIK